jgi:hypothetical protein
VIAVDQYAAWTQRGGACGVHGAELLASEPVQGSGADERVRLPLQGEGIDPTRYAQVPIDESQPAKPGIAGAGEAEQQRIGVDADDLSRSSNRTASDPGPTPRSTTSGSGRSAAASTTSAITANRSSRSAM